MTDHQNCSAASEDAWGIFRYTSDAIIKKGGTTKQAEIAGLHAAIVAAYDVMPAPAQPAVMTFDAWFDDNFLDPDGGSGHLPEWFRGDMQRAWNAAIDAQPPRSSAGNESAAPTRDELRHLFAHASNSDEFIDALLGKFEMRRLAGGDPLDDLVGRFCKALLAKLKLAQANGRSGWEEDDWERQCQEGLLRHVAKGDPRDVAAYCAFMWHHGWITSAPQHLGAVSEQLTALNHSTNEPQAVGVTETMIRAGAAAMCCQAGTLGCAAKNKDSELSTCMISTFMLDAKRCLEAALVHPPQGILSSDNPYEPHTDIDKWLAWDTAWHRLAIEVANSRRATPFSNSDGGVESRHALSQTSPTTQQFQDSRGPRGIHPAGIASGPSEAASPLSRPQLGPKPSAPDALIPAQPPPG